MDESLPHKGAIVYALAKSLEDMGYKLKVTFAPLLRAKIIARKDLSVHAVFPLTDYEEHLLGFSYSKTITTSPWVIAERKDHPIKWNKPEDLSSFVGSHVLQYTLPPEFKKAIDSKKINLESATDDTSNLLKLANKRVDYIFIDATMFHYLTTSSSRVQKVASKLQINSRPVEESEYKIAFRDSPDGRLYLKTFNSLFNRKKFEKYIEDYFSEYSAELEKQTQ